MISLGCARSAALVTLSLGLLAGAAACDRDSSTEAQAATEQAVPVVIGQVERKTVPLEISAVGSVVASSTVDIVSQVTGRIEKVHFAEGDLVKQGDVLFTIDPRPYRAALAEAKARLQRDEVLSKQAQLEAERAASLVDAGVGTLQELERAQSNASSLAATLAADRAEIETNRLNLQFATIRAPIAGRTGSLLVHAGNVVRANGETPLVVIRRVRPVHVRFNVPEQYLGRVREKLAQGPLQVLATPRGVSTPATGKLTLIENAVDTATGSIQLKAEFDNADDALWPGQYADVRLRLAMQEDALVAPEAAVQPGQDGAYVFVVDQQMRATLRPVVVDRNLGTEVVIRSGLEPGERVVVDGQLRLASGMKVAEKPASPTSNAAPASSATPASSAPAVPEPATAPAKGPGDTPAAKQQPAEKAAPAR